MAKKKLMIHDFYRMKKDGEKITFLTSYDYPTAQFAEAAGMDMLLVGDSLGMCVYGYPGTIPVTMDQCIRHAEAVRRGAPNTFVIGDMPFMTYQSSIEKAVENAGRFLKEAGCDAIKLEGGVRVRPRSGPSSTPASSSWGTSASPPRARVSWAATRPRAAPWRRPERSLRMRSPCRRPGPR